MKRNNLLLLLLLITTVTFIVSCKKDDIDHKNDYDKSHQSWMSFKQSSNNSYSYKTSTGSWTGTSTETLITVKDGKVTNRSYVYKVPDKTPGGTGIVKDEWSEDQSTLNTHTAGAPTLTLDEVYQKAKTEWLLKRKDTEVFFEANNNGMISSCGYRDNNCQDDCFNGINIVSIVKL
ncbi:uncharacterized protein YxeA [Pedobacter cryoconitis]|uniref:hypothetical protein n=1 Tax=Pedobacter cryoconitis TaxID=188932 RepID=UPI001799A987|nr:hypothetical protein [Pedobacter cryoconitis]MBB6270980.1 uncharacterized protein YxeA [Pedobacter cryoconitis]